MALVALFVAHILPPARGGALRLLEGATCLGQARRAKTTPVWGCLVTRMYKLVAEQKWPISFPFGSGAKGGGGTEATVRKSSGANVQLQVVKSGSKRRPIRLISLLPTDFSDYRKLVQ